MFSVTVKDTYCGVKGQFVEEQTCHTKEEANGWVKQFRSEYPKDCGYSIKVTTI